MPVSIDLEFATFTQHFLNRVQRRLLGIDLGQDDAWRIYRDDGALRQEFAAWQTQGGEAALTRPL
jgi:hypothetical protein